MEDQDFLNQLQETFSKINTIAAKHSALHQIITAKSCKLTWYLKILLFEFFDECYEIILEGSKLRNIKELKYNCLKINKDGFFIDGIKLNGRLTGETCGKDYEDVEKFGKVAETKLLVAFFMVPFLINSIFEEMEKENRMKSQ